jgi:hypothetical protein
MEMTYTGLRDQSTHEGSSKSSRDDDVTPLIPAQGWGANLRFHAMVYVVLCSITAIALLSYYSGGGGGHGSGSGSDGSSSGGGDDGSGEDDSLTCIPVILHGYDVVEYYQEPEPAALMGNANYSYNMHSTDEDGTLRVYQFWFASQTNLDSFTSDPWHYAPKFGGFCTFGVCCEWAGYADEDDTGVDWPWTAQYLGPPAGPSAEKGGYTVYNNSLYMMVGSSKIADVFKDAETAEANVKIGE